MVRADRQRLSRPSVIRTPSDRSIAKVVQNPGKMTCIGELWSRRFRRERRRGEEGRGRTLREAGVEGVYEAAWLNARLLWRGGWEFVCVWIGRWRSGICSVWRKETPKSCPCFARSRRWVQLLGEFGLLSCFHDGGS